MNHVVLKKPKWVYSGLFTLLCSGKGALEIKPVDKKEIESIPENNKFNPVSSIALFTASASHAILPLRDSPRILVLNKTKPTHCLNITSVWCFPRSNFWDGWVSLRCEISSLQNGQLCNLTIKKKKSVFFDSITGNNISIFCYYMKIPSHLPPLISRHSVCAYIEILHVLIRCCWIRISHTISEHSSFIPYPLKDAELPFLHWTLSSSLCLSGFSGAWVVPVTLKDFRWVLSWSSWGGKEIKKPTTNKSGAFYGVHRKDS